MQFKDTDHIEQSLKDYNFSEKLDKKIKQLIPDEDPEVYESLNVYTYKNMIKILQKETTIQTLDKDFESFFQENEMEQKNKLISWIKNTMEQLYQSIKRSENKRKRSAEQEIQARNQEKKQVQQKQTKTTSEKQDTYSKKEQQPKQQEEQHEDNGNGNIMERIKVKQQKTLKINKPIIQNNTNNNSSNLIQNQKKIQIPNKKEQQNQKIVQKQFQRNTQIQKQQIENQEQNDIDQNQQTQQNEEKPQDADEQKKKIKCKYYPNCKIQTTCPYHHPSEDCTHFPNCKFGSACLNKHPACNYGVRCTRMDCFYEHPPGVKRTQAYNPAMQMYPPFPYKQMMMPVGGPRRKPPSKVKMASGPQKKPSQEITTK